MTSELADALAKRGRVWGQDNASQLNAVRRGEAPVKFVERPSVSAYSLDMQHTGGACPLQRVVVSGTVTRIRPAQ